jgi:hypothetical protein
MTMFFVVWPMVGVCAVANNFLVARAQMFSLLRAHRRPVPVRVGDRGIGEWGNVLLAQTVVAVPVCTLFLVLSTGQIEYWLCDEESMREHTAEDIMRPNLGCMSLTKRLGAAMALENTLFALLAVIWMVLPPVESPKAKEAAVEQRLANLPPLPPQDDLHPGVRALLYRLFEWLDTKRLGYLDFRQTGQMLRLIGTCYALEELESGAGGDEADLELPAREAPRPTLKQLTEAERLKGLTEEQQAEETRINKITARFFAQMDVNLSASLSLLEIK